MQIPRLLRPFWTIATRPARVLALRYAALVAASSPKMRARLSKSATPALLVALAYFVTGRLGLMLPAFGSNITLLWMPTGLAVAVLLRSGFGCWPGVALGSVAVNLANGIPLPVALAIAVGNTLGPMLAASILRRIGFHPAFDREHDILLLASAAVAGMLVSSTLGSTSLALAGLLPAGRIAGWLTWWAGDIMGVIAAAPLVFAFTRQEVRAILFRSAEFAVWLGATVVVTWGVFVLNRGSDGQPWALAFVPLPLVAWAALRFGPSGTSLALILISVGAAYGTATGRGPFFRPQPVEGVAVLWTYMATSAVLGWLVSALHQTRAQAAGIQRIFEQALSDVSLGVLLTGLDRRITYANEGFARLTGYPEAEMLGKDCALLQGPDTAPATVQKLGAALRDDGFFDGEILNYRKDGSPFWNALLISPVRDARGAMTGFLGIQRDVTQRREAELALHAAALEREQLERKVQETQKLESLGVLAGGIAHDFNNLLTSVLGHASIAAMELPPTSSVQDCLAQITESARRAADLCKQMLAYSGRGRFLVQKLDLGQLVEDTAQMLHLSISKKAVLRFHLEKNLPPIEADATQLRQVIMNLVINASEAIGETSGVISLATGLARVDRAYLAGTLVDASLSAGEYVFLEVADTGTGMSPETQARIFDPFFTTKFTGRGLGLAAVLGIVRGHKGALKVHSEPGRGTTFKLLFPAAASAPAPADAASPSAPVPEWRGTGTVLVVDDEETVRSTVARMLPHLGCTAVLASDGQEGVAVFATDPRRFTLVLLDLTMPRMDGEQAFAELRRLRGDARVVLMSGFNQQEALVRFAGQGLASFLQKPFTVADLRAVMQDVLG